MEILENKIKTLEEVFEKKVKGLETSLKGDREKNKSFIEETRADRHNAFCARIISLQG